MKKVVVLLAMLLGASVSMVASASSSQGGMDNTQQVQPQTGGMDNSGGMNTPTGTNNPGGSTNSGSTNGSGSGSTGSNSDDDTSS